MNKPFSQNILDLILHMMLEVRVAGKSLSEVKTEELKKFNKAEVSAAYSWILQHQQDLDDAKSQKPPRVLHIAERMIISPEAHGYLLQLQHAGIINELIIEKVIEMVMFNNPERVSLEKVKTLISKLLFEGNKAGSGNNFLTGTERIN